MPCRWIAVIGHQFWRQQSNFASIPAVYTSVYVAVYMYAYSADTSWHAGRHSAGRVNARGACSDPQATSASSCSAHADEHHSAAAGICIPETAGRGLGASCCCPWHQPLSLHKPDHRSLRQRQSLWTTHQPMAYTHWGPPAMLLVLLSCSRAGVASSSWHCMVSVRSVCSTVSSLEVNALTYVRLSINGHSLQSAIFNADFKTVLHCSCFPFARWQPVTLKHVNVLMSTAARM